MIIITKCVLVIENLHFYFIDFVGYVIITIIIIIITIINYTIEFRLTVDFILLQQ